MKTEMERYKILAQFVKDASCETKDIQTFLFVKDFISEYSLTIDIASKATKNKLIEINTTLKFEDKKDREKKAYFEITYTTIVKINEKIKEKDDLSKIILVDVQNEIYPKIEKTFLDLLHNSGYKNVSTKKVDFNKLYENRSN
jgi:preprotein translocase subunit SecB